MQDMNWIELVINVLLASLGGAVKKLVDQEKDARKTAPLCHFWFRRRGPFL